MKIVNYNYGIGILIFNPLDDEYHLERIESCLISMIQAINNYNGGKVKLLLLLNNSFVEHIGLNGIGDLTRKRVVNILENSDTDYEILEKEYNNSMALGYNTLFKTLFEEYKAKKISVFADDYIIPKNWFRIITSEFNKFESIDYLIPSTSFVAQKNLLVPLKIKEKWTLNKVNDGKDCVGVSKDISLADVEEISNNSQKYSSISHVGPPSFETTVFKFELLEKHGLLCEDYHFLFFNSEYFMRLKQQGAKGIISRKSFVFHYGKGGTKAVFKKTGDEKHKNSPFEKYLLKDISLYNKRNNKNILPWWGKESKIVGNPHYLIIKLLLVKFNFYSFLKKSAFYKILKKLV